MKALILSGGILVFAAAVFVTVGTDVPNAALTIFSDTERACKRAVTEAYGTHPKDAVSLQAVDLDGDGTDDYIAKLSDACGSGGCVHELCIRNESGGVEYVPFGFAAHELSVMDTLTNGMRDIMVNNEPSLRLSWDGASYQLTN